MNIRIRLEDPRAVLPVQRDGDAGADLYAIHAVTIYPGCIERVSFGIAVEIPEGYEGQIRPRSGLSSRGFIAVTGTIDSGFRGVVGAVLMNLSRDDAWHIKQGDRVAQLVISPAPRVTYEPCVELSDTERGPNGWGSSGV